MLSDISIEPFRGDLEGLEAMATSSYRDEYGIESLWARLSGQRNTIP